MKITNNIQTGLQIFATNSISGTFTQSLSSLSMFKYTLTGSTTFEYLNPQIGSYNFIVDAGSNLFKLGTNSNYYVISSDLSVIGSTGSGLSGSFIIDGKYDGNNMWVSYKSPYISMPKGGGGGATVNRGNVLALDATESSSYSGGSTWYDLSGNSNNVTLYNTTSGGNYVQFSGDSSSYGEASHSSSLNISKDITIEAWIKVDEWMTDTHVTPVAKQSGSGGGNYTLWMVGGSSGYNVLYYSGDFIGAGSGNYFTTGVWYQVIFRQDSTSYQSYVDTVLSTPTYGDGVAKDLTTNSETITIGKRKDNYGLLKGKIGVINVWNRKITDQEILDNYNYYSSIFV